MCINTMANVQYAIQCNVYTINKYNIKCNGY